MNRFPVGVSSADAVDLIASSADEFASADVELGIGGMLGARHGIHALQRRRPALRVDVLHDQQQLPQPDRASFGRFAEVLGSDDLA